MEDEIIASMLEEGRIVLKILGISKKINNCCPSYGSCNTCTCGICASCVKTN